MTDQNATVLKELIDEYNQITESDRGLWVDSEEIEALTALLDEVSQTDKKINAAETVSRIYFEIAADALGEDTVKAAFNEKLSRELKGEIEC